MVDFHAGLMGPGVCRPAVESMAVLAASSWGWLHGFSDFVISGALGVIAAALFVTVRRQPETPQRKLLRMLAGCLVASAVVHFLQVLDGIWTLRGLTGIAKLGLAGAAGGVAWMLWPVFLVPPADTAESGGRSDASPGANDQNELTERLQSEVTARRRVEQSLRESDERLRLVVGAGRMGTWDWDLATGATRLDRRERHLFGLPDSRGTVHVDDIFAHIHPDDRDGVRSACQKSIDQHTAYDHEFRVVLGDGSIRWLAGRGDVVRNASGDALRMVGVNFDITDRRSSEQHYQLIDRALESATNGIIIADAQCEDFPITYVNKGFEALTGFGRDEAIGRNCRFLQGRETDRETVASIRAALASGDECTVTILNQRKDGTPFWNELRITPVRDESGRLTHFVGVQADVTERKQFEESLQRAEARAQAASQAKSEFLANMSHEIRTPLTAVLGCADTLFPRLTAQEHREMVQMIRNQGRLLLGILNDVLDLSKIEAGRLEIHREACSIVSIIEDVRSLLQPQAIEKGLGLESQYASLMPVEVRTDPLRVRQVLVNLVGNAIKFTEQGQVTIVAFCDVESSPPQIVFNVRDSGIGIARDKLDAIFEAFSQESSQMSRKVGGTGLGLTISQRLLTMLGGSIRVASRQNQGTTFTVSLPISIEETQRMQTGGDLTLASIEQQRSRDSMDIVLAMSVLLAEDTRGLQFMIRRMLEDAGATVAVVENGERAVQEVHRAERSGHPFDVVLMDMQMPVLNGFEATEQLRRTGCRLPIIALTAAAMEGDREKCLAAGCDDYLSKPIDRHALLEVVARRYNLAVVDRR
ncbi:MAG: PAS domain S-box protein [Planctomycetaceae bacterium]|nr:PAS domain S-box protein [Planctomycetaceae bacterium]